VKLEPGTSLPNAMTSPSMVTPSSLVNRPRQHALRQIGHVRHHHAIHARALIDPHHAIRRTWRRFAETEMPPGSKKSRCTLSPVVVKRWSAARFDHVHAIEVEHEALAVEVTGTPPWPASCVTTGAVPVQGSPPVTSRTNSGVAVLPQSAAVHCWNAMRDFAKRTLVVARRRRHTGDLDLAVVGGAMVPSAPAERATGTMLEPAACLPAHTKRHVVDVHGGAEELGRCCCSRALRVWSKPRARRRPRCRRCRRYRGRAPNKLVSPPVPTLAAP